MAMAGNSAGLIFTVTALSVVLAYAALVQVMQRRAIPPIVAGAIGAAVVYVFVRPRP